MSYSNHVVASLHEGIGAGSTTIKVVKAVAPYQDPPAAGYLTLADSLVGPTKLEIVLYTGRTDNTTYWSLTGVTRAQGGTSAFAFSIAAPVYQALAAADIPLVAVPATAGGDAAKILEVNPGETGYQLVTRAASETVTGFIELATQIEVNAGTDSVRAITPATLTARVASETLAGIIELATQAEVNAGADVVRAVTPATLKAATSITPFPAGTKIPFYQVTAPTGWTPVAINDKALRAVTSGTSGGSTSGSTPFSTLAHVHTVTGSVDATTLSTAQIPAHAHNIRGWDGSGGSSTANLLQGPNASTGDQATVNNTGTDGGSGGSHTHAMSSASAASTSINPACANVVIATKDA